jgi:predicted small lipoprotein YifL
MKTLTTILTLLILIGCGHKKQDQNQTTERTELIPEPDKNTEIQKKKDQIENKPNNKCNCDGLVDWQKDEKVKLFDQPNGQIIDTLSHDIKGENF